MDGTSEGWNDGWNEDGCMGGKAEWRMGLSERYTSWRRNTKKKRERERRTPALTFDIT